MAIAFSSNLLLQIKDVLLKLDINSGTLEIDVSSFCSVVRCLSASGKLAQGKSMILLICTGPRPSSCSEAF